MRKIAKKFLVLMSLSALVFGLLYWLVAPQALGQALAGVKKAYLLAALLSFLAFRGLEALGLWLLLRRQKLGCSYKRTLEYSFIGYFFSQLTPSGGGGQPAQLFFMVRDGLSSGHALMALFPFNFTYHISLLLMGSLAYGLLKNRFDLYPLRILFIYGLLAQLTMIVLVFLCLVREDWLPGLLSWLMRVAKRLPVLRRLAKKEAVYQQQMQDFKREARRLKGNLGSLLVLLPIQAAMLLAFYMISYFIYRSLGGQGFGLVEILMLQCFVAISSESIPTPGAVGVTETSLYAVFSQVMPANKAFVWMFLSRACSLYLGLLLGLPIFYLRRK